MASPLLNFRFCDAHHKNTPEFQYAVHLTGASHGQRGDH